jgi:GT2 family glycosyltransferase
MQTQFPLVYVIIVNWNGWRDTLQCLASLRELNYPNYKTIVVDNASTDESVHRIQVAFPDVIPSNTQKETMKCPVIR